MSKKILIIDDEEIIIKSVKKLLEAEGFEVFVIKNGEDALAVAEEEDFDLIISDVRMPGISGIEVVRRIYASLEKRESPRPPFMFVTGYADKDCEKQAKTLDAAAYIYKPFDISEFLEIVNRTLGASDD
jgi:CheY-like chemotaxis protein